MEEALFLGKFRLNGMFALLSVEHAIWIDVTQGFIQKKLAGFNDGVVLIRFFLVRTALDGIWFFPEKENT